MFFKHSLLWIASLVLISFTGCDSFLKSAKSKDQKANEETISLKPADLQCLAEFPKQIQDYVKDKATPASIEVAFACLDKSITTFVKFYRGERADQYTDEELRHFLNRYLLKDNQISTEFMNEIMKIKMFLIGGSAHGLTRTELDQVQADIKLIKEEVLKIQGSLGLILFQETSENATDERIEKAETQVRASFKRLLLESKVAGSMYEFADFKDFVSELGKFLGDTVTLQKALKWMPLMSSVKELFWGDHSRLSTSRQWQASMDWAIRGYFLGLNSFYRFRPFEFKSRENWSSLLTCLDRGFDLIEQAPVFQADGRLSADSIDRVLEEVWKLNLIKTELSVAVMKKTYRTVILRILDRNQSRQAQVSEVLGLEKKHLAVLRFEYNVWRLSEEMILDLFKDRPVSDGASPAEIADSLRRQDVGAKIRFFRDGDTQREPYEATWSDWARLLTLDRPIQWTANLKLLMVPNASRAKTSFQGLNLMNAVRFLTRAVQRGYGQGTDPNVFKLQLSEPSLVYLEDDFHEIGQMVGFLDPRSKKPAERTFKEANFFTFHGDGNDWMTGLETFEELNFMISGGGAVINEIMESARAAGCQTGQLDPLGKPYMKADCYEKVLRANFTRFFEGLPLMSQEIAAMNETQWQTFYGSLMTLSAVEPKALGLVEFAEARTSAVVLHYVEGLMMMYDRDYNNKLTEAEVTAVAPRFRAFIQNISPLGGFLVDDIFLCLVYKGKKPSAWDLTKFMIEKSTGLGDVGRLQLVNVLAILKKDVTQ